MKRLLSYDEAATYLGRTVDALRQMVHRGQVPSVRCGRRTQFDVRALDAWIDEHTVDAS